MPRYKVLVVDDEDFVRESLVDLLENEGFATRSAASGEAALQLIEKDAVHVIATDLQMPSVDGLALLNRVRERGLDTPVVLLTGVGTVPDAVAAMKAGAFDFIQKPVEPQQFLHIIRRAIEHGQLVQEVRYLRDTVNDLRGPREMLGDSEEIRQVRSLIDKVAPSDATVLITGESGTGKELAALELHRKSNRAAGNLVRVNCAAVSESLFESEFFGHRRGSFTSAVEDRAGRFHEAEGGTLVLDEIGTLKPEMQAKLLRVLETGEYQVVGESKTRVADVRLIAITNQNLEECVVSGEFRADLFYRLNIFPIEIPPLRSRPDDLDPLVHHFLEVFRARAGRPCGKLSRNCLDLLASYSWPGNVRELRNLAERATILAGEHMPDTEIFEQILRPVGTSKDETTDAAPAGEELEIRARVEQLERGLIQEALERTDGKKKEACALLGIDPKNLSYYMRKHGLSGGGADEGSD